MGKAASHKKKTLWIILAASAVIVTIIVLLLTGVFGGGSKDYYLQFDDGYVNVDHDKLRVDKDGSTATIAYPNQKDGFAGYVLFFETDAHENLLEAKYYYYGPLLYEVWYYDYPNKKCLIVYDYEELWSDHIFFYTESETQYYENGQVKYHAEYELVDGKEETALAFEQYYDEAGNEIEEQE